MLCSGGLQAGERLDVAVLRRASAAAVVRWAADGKAGLSFAPQPSSEVPAGAPRRHERVSVDGEIAMRRAGKLNFRVHIYDLSPDGCKAAVRRPSRGRRAAVDQVRRDGGARGDVRWIVGQKAGVKFAAADLRAAVFDLLAHPAVPDLCCGFKLSCPAHAVSATRSAVEGVMLQIPDRSRVGWRRLCRRKHLWRRRRAARPQNPERHLCGGRKRTCGSPGKRNDPSTVARRYRTSSRSTVRSTSG